MGYLDGVKGYCIHDITTRAFFTTQEVEFNKNLPNSTNDNSDDDKAPSTSTGWSTITDDSVQPPTNPPTFTPDQAVPHQSTCNHWLTTKGAAWAAKLATTCAHLKQLQECREATSQSNDNWSLLEGVWPEDIGDLLIESSQDRPEVVANVVIEEQAYITIQSNKQHNLKSEGYNMSIPPTTYDEAV